MDSEILAAAASGNVEEIRRLLIANTSFIDVENAEKQSLLHISALYGHAELVHCLLTFEFLNVNAKVGICISRIHLFS